MAPRSFVPYPNRGLNHPNVASMFGARVAKTPGRPALRHKQGSTWRTLTWAQWDQASREIAAGFWIRLGIGRGDRVAIMCDTRLEWALIDVALAQLGAVSVPIYPSLTADHTTYILQDSGCRVAVIEHPGHRLKVVSEALRDRIGALEHLVVVDEAGLATDDDDPDRGPGGPPSVSLAELRSVGVRQQAEAEDGLRSAGEAVGLDDEFTYVYTSGTTGTPKGVVLSQRNMVFEAWAIRNVIPVDETDEQLLIMPLAHIFSRHLLWGAVEQGAVSAFVESLDRMAENMLEVAPTFVGAVPRVYEKVYNRILADVAHGGVLKQGTFQWCMEVGRKASVCRQRGQAPPPALSLKLAVADRLMFARIRGIFGGRLRFFVSGGAPLSQEIAEFFHAAGVLILEGYGLTETTGATNVNRPDRYRFGTVGPAMPGCEIRIAADGEVLVRGNNVMVRYHNQPDETAAVLDDDGWFSTGDVGELTDGFLRITDRKKDLIKTAGGKYIAPQPIENRLKTKEGVSQVMVYADYRPFAVALVTLDEVAMMALAEREGLGARTYSDLVGHPRVRQILQGYVDDVNADLARYETIKRFEIPPEDFSLASGELTPTHKVKRKVVMERYRDLINSMYDGAGAAQAS